MSVRLFVYGTLRFGGSNNWRLDNDEYIGCAQTEERFYMVCQPSRSYPFCARESMIVDSMPTVIQGEVYEVSPTTLAALDTLEGHPTRYTRQPVRLMGGTLAQMYVLENPDIIAEIRSGGRFVAVTSGDWLNQG